jgi:hypothetical protein
LNIILENRSPESLKELSMYNISPIIDAVGVKFYYRGGADILAIRKEGQTFNVFVPGFSLVQSKDVYEMLRASEEIILEQIKLLSVADKVSFLFDTNKKIILRESSFGPYIPLFGLNRCLFVLEAEPGHKKDPCVYSLSDKSAGGQAMFGSLMVAKEDLLSPATGRWTPLGIKVLMFLVSHRYVINQTFDFDYGPWDTFHISGLTDSPHKLIHLSKLNTNKLYAIARKAAYTSGATVDKDDDKVRLSDMLQIGLDSFLDSAFTGEIKVEIDMMRDQYKSIVIDSLSSLCLIELATGSTLTLDQLKEDLQSERIQLLTQAAG